MQRTLLNGKVLIGARTVLVYYLYVDVLIKMIKTRSPPDGFLAWLHVLMLMDDTVILATSRKELENKLGVLREYCDEYGMQVNESKTQFMVINGTPRGRESIVIGNLTVSHCTSYVYLGVIVTENGSATTSLKAHAARTSSAEPVPSGSGSPMSQILLS